MGKSRTGPMLKQVFPRAVLDPLLFLIYINDLLERLSMCNDTILFSVIHDRSTSALELNNDYAKITRCAFQWKMNFNQYLKKQEQVIVS